MLNFTDEVDLLTRGDDPAWSDQTAEMLDNHPIDVIYDDVTGIQNGEDGWLKAMEFEAGPVRSEEISGIPDDLLEGAVDFHTYDRSADDYLTDERS